MADGFFPPRMRRDPADGQVNFDEAFRVGGGHGERVNDYGKRLCECFTIGDMEIINIPFAKKSGSS